MSNDPDAVEFDDLIAVALARSVSRPDLAPRPEVKARLMEQITAPPAPDGFSFRFDAEGGWVPHPLPGIMMKVLSINRAANYATVLFDVAPGTQFPPHHHHTAEECYVISGSLYTCGRRLGPGRALVAAEVGTPVLRTGHVVQIPGDVAAADAGVDGRGAGNDVEVIRRRCGASLRARCLR